MNRLKVITSVCIGTLVYVLVSLFGGQGGVSAMAHLETERAILNKNVEEIQKINDNLTIEYEGLKSSNEVIAGYAKKLGFVTEGEKLIKVNGLGRQYNKVYETGSIVRRTEIQYIPEWICKAFGLAVFFLSILFFWLLGLLSPSQKKKRIDQQSNSVQNIGCYETIKI